MSKNLNRGGCLSFVQYYCFPHFYRALPVLLSLALSVLPARATITVLNYWHMGETDPGATVGGAATSLTASVGSTSLKVSGPATYASNVSSSAAAHAFSSLSVNFTNSAFASNSIVSTLQNNFGVEAWVNPASTSGNPIMVYNGNSGTSGWGIIIENSTYQGLFGGVVYVGTYPVTNNVWTHVALVRNNGVATFYINGIAAGATVATSPNVPVGNFAVAAPPQSQTTQFFTGLVDEVRVFSFTAGQFSTNDLLLNSPQVALVGSTNLLVGPAAGSNSVVLGISPVTTSWTADTTATWLHLSTGYQSGIGSTNVIFTYDANAGSAPRVGTLAIAGQTVTVTQAGSLFATASMLTNVVFSGLKSPGDVAVDGSGNVYIADSGNNAIKKWTMTNNLVTTLVSSGLNGPDSVAVDSSGNVYIADTGNSAIKKWTATTGVVTTLVGSGLDNPGGVAVDGSGNVYIADTQDGAIKKWTATNSTVTTLVSGLVSSGLAVDAAGNLYIADGDNSVIKKLTAASGLVTTLVAGLGSAFGVAVDGSGNLYIADYVESATKKWTATSGALTVLESVSTPSGVAVDSAGNVYLADDTQSQTIQELQSAYVDTVTLVGSAAAGSSVLPATLPTTDNLQGTFTPVSDSPWLTVKGATNGVVSFSFTANPIPYTLGRTGHVIVLGQAVPILQLPVPYALLGTSNLLMGPVAGTNSVSLAVSPAAASWTASTNATWLHLSVANQSGAGSTNVIFTCDANPGATRIGTVTIAGQTLTITQAGSAYVAAGVLTTLVSSGLSYPAGLAVDSSGNVYIADTDHSAIKKWAATNNAVTTLVSSGLSYPDGLAVDGAGNVYISDLGNLAIKKWTVGNGLVTTVVTSSSSSVFGATPRGLSLDLSGNIYVADSGSSSLEQWSVSNSNVTRLVSSGLSQPYGAAVDGAGLNVYIADAENNAVKKWTAVSDTVTTVTSSGLSYPSGVAVDGSGNVYIADTDHGGIDKWTAASGAVTTLVAEEVLDGPDDLAVDGSGNVYLADTDNSAIKELPQAFVNTATVTENAAAGSDVLPVVLPATENLQAPFAPVSDSSWLTIQGATNGVVYFSFAANNVPYTLGRTAHITLLGQSVPVTQLAFPYALLGTTNLLMGPAAASNSVSLAVAPAATAWTASPVATWLHLSAASQSGTGSTNIIFSCDANPGATRAGTLTIAGQTLTVTQASSTYVPAGVVTTLVPSGLSYPGGLAVDGSGNVYIADSYDNAIKKWTLTNNTVTTLASSGLEDPADVALDAAGDVYISDSANNAIKEWTATSGLVTTVASGPPGGHPAGLSLDLSGNIYAVDYNNFSLEQWAVNSSNLTTLVSSGLSHPYGVAADGAGVNVYIGDSSHNAIKKWTDAGDAVTTLVGTGLNDPQGVAVDGSGNVYIADSNNGAVKKWTAVSNTVITLVSSGLSTPAGVVVDGSGNLYIADTANNVIKELPQALVNTAPVTENTAAGNDVLPVVLPATENLLVPFAPVSDSPWLTIQGATNGVVYFSFAANNSLYAGSRTAHITLLGRVIPVTQVPAPYQLLGTTNLLVGPAAGSNSVALQVVPATGAWTASTNSAWLHLSVANQSGAGCTNVIFSYAANPGATRVGTLTIAGQTVSVTQAGSTYVAARPVTTLVSSGLGYPDGLAVDGAGNVYIADTGNNAVRKWLVASNMVITLVSSGLNTPGGVAVDGSGNVYIADTVNGAIKEWSSASGTVATVVSSGLSGGNGGPETVVLDAAGNLYIAGTGNNTVDKWTAASSNVTALVSSGLNYPFSVAVDSGGNNVYIADTDNNAIKQWTAAGGNVITLVSSGLTYPYGMAADGSGNVYIGDGGDSAIKEWVAASGMVATLVTTGLTSPKGVAVDAAGNVYIADSNDSAIKELPYAFVNPSARTESAAAGSDALPAVLPVTENLLAPFAPASDSSWLTLGGITNGVVSFSFTANTGAASRVAHITLLGQTNAITQEVVVTPPLLTGVQVTGNGILQFTFTNNPAGTFTVWSTTNLTLPFTNWTDVGAAANLGSGVFQFTSSPTTNNSQLYYRVTSP